MKNIESVTAAHERAVKRGERMVESYKTSEKHWGDYSEALTDMLADLFHYAHELQVDRELEDTIEELIGSATMHFTAEMTEEIV